MTTTFSTEPSVSEPHARRSLIGVLITAGCTLLFAGGMLFFEADRLLTGVLTIGLMLGLMLIKVPIGIAMTLPGVLGILVLVGPRAVTGTLQDALFTTFASWSYSVIPMFVLMGVALGKSGLMAKAFEVARRWLGWLPGGLAVSTNFAGAGLASTSGSSIGIAYAIGRVAVPVMIREKYPPSLALGAVAATGSLGMVIPPSILLVIYAGVAETSVGAQLMAGIVPGVILALLFTAVIVVWSVLARVKEKNPVSYSWRQRFAVLPYMLPMMIIAVVVLGGIYWGVFTATEAGAIGAAITVLIGIGAVVVTAVMRRRVVTPARGDVRRALGSFMSETVRESVAAVSSIFLLLVGVLVLTKVMALSGLAGAFADLIIELDLDRTAFLLLLIPLYLVLGIFLESLPMMLLTFPVLLGPLTALDVDLLWFGIFFIIIAEIDLIAPPLGVLNFVVHSIARQELKDDPNVRIRLTDVYKGVFPFIAAAAALVVLLTVFPEIVTWLPSLSATE